MPTPPPTPPPTPAAASLVEVLVYADGASAGRVGRVVKGVADRVRVLGVAGQRTGAVGGLGQRLGVSVESDLRKLLIQKPAAYLLLGTMAGIGLEDLQPAAAGGTVVLSLDPVATDLGRADAVVRAVRGSHGLGHGLRLDHLPPFMRSPAPLACPDPMPRLGTRRVASFFTGGPREDATLFARLFDAWVTLLRFCDLPESISGSVTPDPTATGMPNPTGEPPENLRDLTGSVLCHARLPDGGAITLHAADRHAAHTRRLHVIGDAGELCLTDTAWRLQASARDDRGDDTDDAPPDGHSRLIDQGHAPGFDPHADDPATLTWPDLAAWQWRRMLDRSPTAPAPAEPPLASLAEPLACCEASLLSARTRQPESPWKMLEIGR